MISKKEDEHNHPLFYGNLSNNNLKRIYKLIFTVLCKLLVYLFTTE